MKRLCAILLTLCLAQGAWALDLHSAKDQGLVGEANTGFLAAVGGAPSSEVRALIDEVNRKRKAEFEATAARTDANYDQVRLRFYQLAVERSAPGHYYQDEAGGWRRK